MSAGDFDLLVIGGGITGAGIALDASARGLKVALIEMQDFASGTSGRSTKLIHGGLRYLKQLEFKLVAEVGKEREIVHKNAPHLTKPEHMLLPIVKNGSLNKFSARIAMWVYEFIAGVKKEERHKVLNKEQISIAEPYLKKDNLMGGILFYEYRTDDARLTIEVMKEAVDRGALVLNYFKAISFIYENNKIIGVNAEDKITGTNHKIKARYVINAGGPWVDEIDDLEEKRTRHKLQITKGIHLVVDQKKIPVKQSVYFDTFDKRMIFVIPRDGKTYMGTTDTFYEGDLVSPTITNKDRDYILKCVNEYFPGSKLVASDIESGWAGLRPLVNKPGKGPSEISRKDEIFEFDSGLMTIAGGKLTGYRKMAQRIVDLVVKKMEEQNGIKIAQCSTQTIPVSGGKINSDFYEFLKSKIAKGIALGLSVQEAEILAYRYGSNVDELFEIIRSQKQTNELPLNLTAELIYSIEKEMCVTPSDFFVRRTSALYFDIEKVKKFKEPMVKYMQDLLGWSDELKERFDMELREVLEEVVKMRN